MVTRLLLTLPIAVVPLMAADPAWKAKRISDWTEADARQVLTDSPWCMTVVAGITRRQTEDERRAGGEMGQAKGVGFDGVDDKFKRPELPDNLAALVLKPTRYSPGPPQFMKLLLRWESALPIRVAELKTGVIAPPTLDNDGYSIAVYGIPGEYFKGDPKSLGDPLKKEAVLKRDGQKDVRPSSAEVFQLGHGVVVAYVFPSSMEITRKDGHVAFEAQIGRLVFKQTFNLEEMQVEGKSAF
jgi:hypothetical protein